ncbi:hypothetical protein A3Q56_02881 [Intoshia linei]|uniref:Uncharacterized protein n=1 Tax=Intoshia linei TaxID=1819745 RepID=A0A177B6N1_9BILA|nr:hypothetical protein A3Q56_02881 [Intoshia linei]
MGCAESSVTFEQPRQVPFNNQISPAYNQQNVTPTVLTFNPINPEEDIALFKTMTPEELMQEYMKIENEINSLESKNVQMMYETKLRTLDNIADKLNVINQNTLQMTGNEIIHDDNIFKYEYNAILQQKDQINYELQTLQPDVQRIRYLYKKLDNLLCFVYQGDYGSEKENNLEKNYETIEVKREKLSAWLNVWLQGKNIIQHAMNQFSTGCQYFSSIKTVSQTDSITRVLYATNARNQFIAGLQNLTLLHQLIYIIELPYCKKEEIVTVWNALNNIYNDILHDDRCQYALSCYLSCYSRIVALMKWTDKVIESIEVELVSTNNETEIAAKSLRNERLLLMKEKMGIKDIAKHVTFDFSKKKSNLADKHEEPFKAMKEIDDANNQNIKIDKNMDPYSLGGSNVNIVEDNAPLPTNLFDNIDLIRRTHLTHEEKHGDARLVNRVQNTEKVEERIAKLKAVSPIVPSKTLHSTEIDKPNETIPKVEETKQPNIKDDITHEKSRETIEQNSEVEPESKV